MIQGAETVGMQKASNREYSAYKNIDDFLPKYVFTLKKIYRFIKRTIT